MNFVVMALMMVGMIVFMHGRGNHMAGHGAGHGVQAEETRPCPPGVTPGGHAMPGDLPPAADAPEDLAATLPEAP